jgi:hypothetical protein
LGDAILPAKGPIGLPKGDTLLDKVPFLANGSYVKYTMRLYSCEAWLKVEPGVAARAAGAGNGGGMSARGGRSEALRGEL